jgi:hypothetical protein
MQLAVAMSLYFGYSLLCGSKLKEDTSIIVAQTAKYLGDMA